MKILYLMFCDWDWIKQRPHFLAEELSKKNDITVLYPKIWWANKTVHNDLNPKIKYKKMITFPKFRTNKTLKVIVNCINRYKVNYMMGKEKYDVIWISHPDHYEIVKSQKNIVYDCMDNYSELENKSYRKEEVKKYEKEIIKVAKEIFVSSEWLGKRIQKMYDYNQEHITLVRNAYNGIRQWHVVNTSENSQTLKLCYIGTISEWFDWNVIRISLDIFSNIEYHLFGPIANTTIYDHSRVYYHGVVKHNELFDYINKYDVLLMPFNVTALIEAVDPVKLYEYVNFGKNIISIYYDEIKRFDEYVYFYNSVNDYITIIESLLMNNHVKYSDEQSNNLLLHNTWEDRLKCIEQKLLIVNIQE